MERDSFLFTMVGSFTCRLPPHQSPPSSSSGPFLGQRPPPWPAGPGGSSWSRLEWAAGWRWLPLLWPFSPLRASPEASQPETGGGGGWAKSTAALVHPPTETHTLEVILTTSVVSSSDEWCTSTHSPSSSSSLMLALSQPSGGQDKNIHKLYTFPSNCFNCGL